MSGRKEDSNISGTKAGGLKCAATNKAKNPNFYAEIGAAGGRNGNTGGFASLVECSCDLIDHPHYKKNCAGKKGGATSRRGKKQ